ncbi:MotA/TolQ/ExbB proton channel family protein [Candidatus Poribacteria bacterium]|nr:MotA/TolQ/ExbB proton channel family protein [Candidatus Poribacteria bacterium]
MSMGRLIKIKKKLFAKKTIYFISMFLFIVLAGSVLGVEEGDIAQKSTSTSSWLLDMYVRGGFSMHLILATSVIGVMIIIEKAVKIRKNVIMPDAFIAQVKNIVKSNDVTQLMELCKDKDIQIAKILDAGLKQYKEGISAVQGGLDNQGACEVGYMSKNLQLLGTLANIAPLFGFLGTVTGMTTSFGVIAGYGSSRPDLLAGGVAEALITTVYGLFVGIPLLVAYYYFDGKISLLSLEMQEFSTNTITELMLGGDLGGI